MSNHSYSLHRQYNEISNYLWKNLKLFSVSTKHSRMLRILFGIDLVIDTNTHLKMLRFFIYICVYICNCNCICLILISLHLICFQIQFNLIPFINWSLKQVHHNCLFINERAWQFSCLVCLFACLSVLYLLCGQFLIIIKRIKQNAIKTTIYTYNYKLTILEES